MKATDLMCGDLVLINGTPHKIQAIDSVDEEISADDELYFVGEDRCHSEDKIEGIPLTKEILQKNDWGYVCETYFRSGIRWFPEIRITSFIKNVGKLHKKSRQGRCEIFSFASSLAVVLVFETLNPYIYNRI